MIDEQLLQQDTTDPEIEAMAMAGVHLGHRASKLHPRMKGFVVGLKNTTHVINLEETAKRLKKALDFISQSLKEGKTMLLVGTKPPLRNLIREMAKEANLPFVAERWLGGAFTNFPVIRSRVNYFSDLLKKKESGELEKYTKKEIANFEKELADLKIKFEGLVNMDKLPEIVFICDIIQDELAVKEAKAKGIKTIGIVDSNADPMAVDFPIPANDDAITAVRYILEKVRDVVQNKNDAKRHPEAVGVSS